MDTGALLQVNPVDNIRAAYRVLDHRVQQALRTQVGDAPRLQEARNLAMSLLQAAEPVRVPTSKRHMVATNILV